MKFGLNDLVGRYRLVMSPELVTFIERAFVAAAPPADQERVRAEARSEAEQAELEIDAAGSIVSRAGDSEWYRITLSPWDEPRESVEFEKAPGQSVRLELHDRETLVAHQAGKPPAVFRRVGPVDPVRSGA